MLNVLNASADTAVVIWYLLARWYLPMCCSFAAAELQESAVLCKLIGVPVLPSPWFLQGVSASAHSAGQILVKSDLCWCLKEN